MVVKLPIHNFGEGKFRQEMSMGAKFRRKLWMRSTNLHSQSILSQLLLKYAWNSRRVEWKGGRETQEEGGICTHTTDPYNCDPYNHKHDSAV